MPLASLVTGPVCAWHVEADHKMRGHLLPAYEMAFFHLRRLYGTKWGFAYDTNLCHKCNTTHPPLFLFVSFILHLFPASFPQRLDLKFHSKGAISAPVAKWVIIQFEPM